MGDWFKEYFDRVSGSPIDWRWKAFELHHAAQCLKDRLLNDLRERGKALALSRQTEVSTIPDSRHGQVPWSPMDPHLLTVWGMLMGMAIEVLAKALIIQTRPDEHQPGKRAWGKMMTHNLTDLVKRTGLPCDKEGCRVLQDLAACLIWMGRYPAPRDAQSKKATRPSEERLHGGNLFVPSAEWFQWFCSVGEDLYMKLSDKLALALGE